jgi:predicted nuclease of restriction endonuclease-like RecB superfamily
MSSSRKKPSTTSVRVPGGSASLPERLLRVDLREDPARPIWLGARDEAWTHGLLSEACAMSSQTLADFTAAFDDALLPMCLSMGGHPLAVRGMARLLLAMGTPRITGPVRPSELRLVLFENAASGLPREQAIALTAQQLNLPPGEVLDRAFSDRPAARRLAFPSPRPSARQMLSRYNAALARGLLSRAHKVTGWLDCAPEELASCAPLRALLCTCTLHHRGVSVELSGPMGLFRNTTRYGHALAALPRALGHLPWWNLTAHCSLRGANARVAFHATDPLRNPEGPSSSEAAVENRLVRDLRKRFPDWSLQRVAGAIRCGARVLLPDLRLVHARGEVFVELLGFHTRELVLARLQALRAAGIRNYLLCGDLSLGCSEEPVTDPRVVLYRKRLDAGELVERAVAWRCPAPPPPTQGSGISLSKASQASCEY